MAKKKFEENEEIEESEDLDEETLDDLGEDL